MLKNSVIYNKNKIVKFWKGNSILEFIEIEFREF